MRHDDTLAAIQEWQTKYQAHESKPEDRSAAARLCDGILGVFDQIILELSQPQYAERATKKFRISLGRSRDTIALWSDGYGIQRGSMDEVLAKSRDLRRATLKTLTSIANTLLDRLIPLTLAHISSEQLDNLKVKLTATISEALYAMHEATNNAEDDSDASSDGDPESEHDDSISEVAEDLKIDAQCLMELDPLFTNPVLDLSWHKEHQLQALDWAPEKAYCYKVQQRFPSAESSLVERLGKANWARFLRCQSIRNSVESGTQPQHEASVANKGDNGTVAASSSYHDSALGSSLPTTASSYAETVMTYGTSAGKQVRIPPLSDDAKQGKPFPCVACGRSVRFTQNSAWKRHLYDDLQPYMCLEAKCLQQSFANRRDWIGHLRTHYSAAWNSVSCPLCFQAAGSGQFSVMTHLGRHLEEISLAALPVYPDEDDDQVFETDSESESVHPTQDWDTYQAALQEQRRKARLEDEAHREILEWQRQQDGIADSIEAAHDSEILSIMNRTHEDEMLSEMEGEEEKLIEAYIWDTEEAEAEKGREEAERELRQAEREREQAKREPHQAERDVLDDYPDDYDDYHQEWDISDEIHLGDGHECMCPSCLDREWQDLQEREAALEFARASPRPGYISGNEEGSHSDEDSDGDSDSSDLPRERWG